jgi:hypothetical protein
MGIAKSMHPLSEPSAIRWWGGVCANLGDAARRGKVTKLDP